MQDRFFNQDQNEKFEIIKNVKSENLDSFRKPKLILHFEKFRVGVSFIDEVINKRASLYRVAVAIRC